MEIWDAYRADGSKAGIDLIRGEPIPDGLYHMVAEVVVRHADGDHLLMRRDTAKPIYPGLYEMTAGGSTLKGEDALTAAKRELREETGLCADALTPLGTQWSSDRLYVRFLYVYDGDKSAVTLQEGETIDYLWLGGNALLDFVRSDKFVPPVREQLRGYLEGVVERGIRE